MSKAPRLNARWDIKKKRYATVHGPVNDPGDGTYMLVYTDLLPNPDNTYTLGNNRKVWNGGWFGTGGLTSDGPVSVTTLTNTGPTTLGDDVTINGDTHVVGNLNVTGFTYLPLPVPFAPAGSIIPTIDNAYRIGRVLADEPRRWQEGHIRNITVDGTYTNGNYFYPFVGSQGNLTWINATPLTINGTVNHNGGTLTATANNSTLTVGGAVRSGGDLTLPTNVTSTGAVSSTDTVTVNGNVTAGTAGQNNTHTFNGTVNITGNVTFDYPIDAPNASGVETGSYTPLLSYVNPVWYLAPGGPLTYTTYGRYVRIGRNVTVMWRIYWNATYPVTSNTPDGVYGFVMNPSFDMTLPSHLPRSTATVSWASGFGSTENHMGIITTASGGNTVECNYMPFPFCSNVHRVRVPGIADATAADVALENFLDGVVQGVQFINSVIPYAGTALATSLAFLSATGWADVQNIISEITNADGLPEFDAPALEDTDLDNGKFRMTGANLEINQSVVVMQGIFSYLTSGGLI